MWCSVLPDTVKGRHGCFACQLWLASQRALLVYNRTLQRIVELNLIKFNAPCGTQTCTNG